jgi:glucokinase
MRTVGRSIAAVGVDLGGTKLATALFAGDGTILSKSIIALRGCGGAEAGRLVGREIAKAFQCAAGKRLSIQAIGVSVPGVAWRQGTVWAPNIAGWEKYPLRQEIADAISPRRIPVRIESDRVCSILGEAWKGAARGCANAIFMAVGTGIGAGIRVEGRVLRGADGLAGAVGWMALGRPFVPAYKECGCFECHASGRGLAKSAGAPDARAVFEALRRHDPAACKTARQAVELWGIAVANLVSIFNPEKVIFGGGVFGPAARFLDDIRDEAAQWAQPLAMKRVKLEISALGADAGLYGAALIARQARRRPK